MAIDLAAAAVRDQRWFGGCGNAVGGGLRAAVTQIHGNAERVHARYDLAPEHTESGIRLLEAAVADEIAIVVGELNDPDPEAVEHIEPREVAIDHVGVLEAEHQAKRLV